jgi:hypothetical protein
VSAQQGFQPERGAVSCDNSLGLRAVLPDAAGVSTSLLTSVAAAGADPSAQITALPLTPERVLRAADQARVGRPEPLYTSMGEKNRCTPRRRRQLLRELHG